VRGADASIVAGALGWAPAEALADTGAIPIPESHRLDPNSESER
jgi:hypothetical protein